MSYRLNNWAELQTPCRVLHTLILRSQRRHISRDNESGPSLRIRARADWRAEGSCGRHATWGHARCTSSSVLQEGRAAPLRRSPPSCNECTGRVRRPSPRCAIPCNGGRGASDPHTGCSKWCRAPPGPLEWAPAQAQAVGAEAEALRQPPARIPRRGCAHRLRSRTTGGRRAQCRPAL